MNKDKTKIRNKNLLQLSKSKYSKYLRWLGILGILGFTGFMKSPSGNTMYSNFVFFTFFSFFIYFDFRERSDERMEHNWDTANKISLFFLAICFVGGFIFIKVNPWFFKIEFLKITTIEVLISVIFAAYHLIKAFSFYYLDKVI